ncbi:hypothetical protein VPH35_032098 [Triticum aestivum]
MVGRTRISTTTRRHPSAPRLPKRLLALLSQGFYIAHLFPQAMVLPSHPYLLKETHIGILHMVADTTVVVQQKRLISQMEGWSYHWKSWRNYTTYPTLVRGKDPSNKGHGCSTWVTDKIG